MVKKSNIIKNNINIFSNGCLIIFNKKTYDKKIKCLNKDFVMFQKMSSKEKFKTFLNNKNIIYRKKLFK